MTALHLASQHCLYGFAVPLVARVALHGLLLVKEDELPSLLAFVLRPLAQMLSPWG